MQHNPCPCGNIEEQATFKICAFFSLPSQVKVKISVAEKMAFDMMMKRHLSSV